MERAEAIKKVRQMSLPKETMEILEALAPELKESEDERIVKDLIGGLMWQRDNLGRLDPHDDNLILPGFCETVGKHLAWLEKQKDASKAIEAVDRIDKYIDEHLANAHDMKDSDPDKKYYLGWDDALGKMSGILQDVYSGEKQKEQKSIKVEVYEAGKGTTICGQDYKCKKDYKAGNCWYIKDVIYHCSRDGYLTDQNGVSWSCTPEWFNEYIYTNNELADKEKKTFDDYLKVSPSERRKMNMTEILGEEKLAETKKQMEQPEVNFEKELEEEIERFYRTDEYRIADTLGRGFETLARHSAEWGARHSINWGDVQLLDTFILELSREEKDGADWGDSEKFYTEVLRRFHEFNDKKIPEIVAEWGAEHLKKDEYIRKDALLEWAEDFKATTGWSEIQEAMDDLIDKLNSM